MTRAWMNSLREANARTPDNILTRKLGLFVKYCDLMIAIVAVLSCTADAAATKLLPGHWAQPCCYPEKSAFPLFYDMAPGI